MKSIVGGEFNVFLLFVLDIFDRLIFVILVELVLFIIKKEKKGRRQAEEGFLEERDAADYIRLLERRIDDERILLHDVKNHLAVIGECIEKNRVVEADQYLKELGNDRAFHSVSRYTDNYVLNLILARYDSVCREKGVNLYIDAQSGRLEFLSYTEITSLICNLMDNAIEGAAKTEKPFVQLKVDYIAKYKTSLIAVVNSCGRAPGRGKNGEYITTKQGMGFHGTGQRSIKKIVDKYSGTCRSSYDEEMGEFSVNITLWEDRTGCG